MYLPLTGFNKHCETKRGTKMKVGSISSQTVRPAQPSQSVQTQNQNVNNQNDNQKSQNNAASVTSEKFNSHHSKCNMSTQDFLELGSCGETVIYIRAYTPVSIYVLSGFFLDFLTFISN